MGCSDYSVTNDEQSVQSYGPNRPKENEQLLGDVNKKYASMTMINVDKEHDITSDFHNANVYTENIRHNKCL